MSSTFIVLIILLLVFFLADSRLPGLSAFKSLRYPLIIGAGALGAIRMLPRVDPAVLAFIPFGVLSLAVSLLSPEPLLAFLQAVSYFLLVFAVFQYIRPAVRASEGRLLVRVVLLFTALMGVGLALTFVMPSVTIMPGNGRFRGLLGNPNGLGIFSTLFLPLQVIVFDRLLPGRKQLKWVSIGIVLLGIVLSGSRNAMLSTAVFLLLYNTLSGTRHWRMLVLGSVLPLGLIIFALAPLHELLGQTPLGAYLRIENIEAGSGRTLAWAYALTYIQEAPVLGRGAGFDEYIFRADVIPASAYLGSHQGAVHNSYLAFLLNTGAVGLMLYAGFIWQVVRREMRQPLMVALVSAVAISAMFESWLMSAMNSFTIFFLLTVVAVEYVSTRPADLSIPEKRIKSHRRSSTPATSARSRATSATRGVER